MAAGDIVPSDLYDPTGRELAEVLAAAPLEETENPDWHCTVHGEWGDGEYACSYREPGPSGCYGQY
jgi:hypothetical protein